MLERSRDQLIVALLFIGRHLVGAANDEIGGDGRLPEADLAVLLALAAFPGSSQTEIASILGRDKTTLSRTIASLEKNGLVLTRIDPIDGRRKALELSGYALSIAIPALRSVTHRVNHIVSGMTSEEVEACFRLIDMLVEDLSVVKHN